MKYESRVVSLMVCSLAGSSLAFSPTLPLSRWNHGGINAWSYEKQPVQDRQQHTTKTQQDTFRLMNSYLDSLGSAAVDDSPAGTATVEATPFNSEGVKSFHPQRGQQLETKVIETTATAVSPTETPTPASIPNQNVQSQYFPQPQQPMEPPSMTQQPPQQQQQAQPPQQQVQPPNPNFGAPPPQGFQQQPVDAQQSIPPHHDTGYFNQPQPTFPIPESQLPPIPPNVPIPQPPELQPPSTPQNFDPHGPNFGTGTSQVHGQPPPMQQPPMQQPPMQQPPMQQPPMQQTMQEQTMQQPPMQSYSQGATSYSPYQQQQQPSGSQANQVYQPPQTTESYPNGDNVAPQVQQQQPQQQQQQQQQPQSQFGQVQPQTQVYNPSMGSFPQQDLPMQGPPPSNVNGQPVQPQQQQQQQYGSFPQQNPNVTGSSSFGNPTTQAPLTTQQPMVQQQPPQAQVPPPRPQFDPHELMSEQRPNTGGGNWYDTHMRKPNRKFDTVHPWERDNNPQPLPPRNQQPLMQSQQPAVAAQPTFDPHAPSWDRPMLGTPAAASSVPRGVAGGTTNLQGTSWHKDPNSWQGSQGLQYQDHPMNPLAAGMPPVAAVAPPPIQPMNPPKRQPFDPHDPDWARPLSSEIQGESRNTWQNHMGVPRVMVDLFSDGRPIDSEIELWQGPSNEPHKIKMYSEDGGIRPFKAVVETPGYGSSIDIKNSGPTAFPIQANVQPMPFRYEPERFKQVQGENSLYTVSLNDFATSALVTLETDGMPLMALVELWQGPDNTPQKVKVYNEQGLPFQLMVETPGPQCTIAVRNIGPMEFPLYCAISARVD